MVPVKESKNKSKSAMAGMTAGGSIAPELSEDDEDSGPKICSVEGCGLDGLYKCNEIYEPICSLCSSGFKGCRKRVCKDHVADFD